MKTWIWTIVVTLLPAFGVQALEAVAQGGTGAGRGQEITNQSVNGRLGALEAQQGATNGLLQQIITQQAQQQEILEQIANIVITKNNGTSGTEVVSATDTISATVKLPKGSMCGIAWTNESGLTIGTQIPNDGMVGAIMSQQAPCDGRGPARLWQNPGGGVIFGRADCPKDYIFTVVGSTPVVETLGADPKFFTVGTCMSTKSQ